MSEYCTSSEVSRHSQYVCQSLMLLMTLLYVMTCNNHVCGETEHKLNIVIIPEDTKCVVTRSHVSYIMAGLSMRCTNNSFLFFIVSGKISVSGV